MNFGSTVFQKVEEVKNEIESLGVTLITAPMKTLSPAVCFKAKNVEGIVLDCNVPLEEYSYYATHELVHLIHDETYHIDDELETKRISENKANNYTIQKLFPLERLKSAFEAIGFPSLKMLALYFGTTPKILKKVFEHYQNDEDYIKWITEYCSDHETEYLADELEHLEGWKGLYYERE